MADDLWILGLNCYEHDTSACLLRNGEIVVGINKERVTRIKHDQGFYQEIVDYCLETAGIELDRLDLVVRSSYIMPVHAMERQLLHHHQPAHLSGRERRQAIRSPLFLPDSPKVVDISHHLAHAYSAFAVSPFDEGAVMVVDGVGSYRSDVTEELPAGDSAHKLARESESYYTFRGTELTPLRKVWLEPKRGFLSEEFYNMAGLGAMYSRVSTYIFGDWNRCGEVMGLAPYGGPLGARLMELVDGELHAPDWTEDRKPGAKELNLDEIREEMIDLTNPFMGASDQKWNESPHRKEWENLAWQVQDDTERILVERATWLQKQTGAKNLCVAGGVALNCVANGKVLEESPFENMFIQPAAGDDGTAIGCAYYGHHVLKKNTKRTFVMRHAYLGRTYDKFDIEEALRPAAVRLATSRTRGPDVIRDAARLLADGKVLGWFQAGAEFGPRALGNRSIIADPRDPKMKDHVNARVKHRQGFRPFAPAVLVEHAQEYFEGEAESPFMLLVKRVRPEVRDKIPSIVHVDGTARVQTVSRDDNPVFYALITAFAEVTGIHVLLNTSFNLRGQPIVEAPIDAMETFLECEMDALVIHEWIVRKRVTYRALRPLLKALVAARRKLRLEAMMERYEAEDK